MRKLLTGILLGSLLTGITLAVYFNKQKKPEKESQAVYLNFDNTLSSKEEEAPDELKTALLADAKEDTEYMSRCEDMESFGIEDYEFKSESIDLNNDGVKEFFITPWIVCDSLVRGASGNGFIYVYQEIDGVWKKIGVLDGNSYAVKQEQTNGYHDIVTNWHGSAVSGSVTLYQWQKDWRDVTLEYLPILKRFYWDQQEW